MSCYKYWGKIEEIANKLNISKPLVRKKCMLGMQFLRKYIDGEKDE